MPTKKNKTVTLPIDHVLPQIVDLLRNSSTLILRAPAGAGKSTRVPLALMEAGLAKAGQIIMLQPRRVAARAVAARLAQNLNEPLGHTVGYQVRFEQQTSATTRLLVVTEGILGRKLIADPLLSGIELVILDEFHERSAEVDLALAFLREVQSARPELKLLVMSATMEIKPLQKYLGDCAVVDCELYEHERRIDYLPQTEEKNLIERTASGIKKIMSAADDDGGDVLVFLPGARDIQQVAQKLREAPVRGEPEVVILYGALPSQEQDAALAEGTRRRIVLSTNIAETSLTIPKVTTVVDSGLAKIARFDQRTGLDSLELRPISKASADQRAGRAARLGPGRVLRLWNESQQHSRPFFDEPELKRICLAPYILRVLAFAPADPRRFPFFETPAEGAIEQALYLLRMLGAVAPDSFLLTERGHQLVQLPLHPRLGAILLRAKTLSCLSTGASVAALLSGRELFSSGSMKNPAIGDSDLLPLLEALAQGEGGGAMELKKTRTQLLQLMGAQECGVLDADTEKLSRLLLAGYADRLCRRRGASSDQAVMVGGRGMKVHPSSVVKQAPLFLALRADAGERGLHAQSSVLIAHAIEEKILAEELPWQIRQVTKSGFNQQREAVLTLRQRYFADLLLNEQAASCEDPDAAALSLATAAAERFSSIFKPDARTRQLLGRLSLAKKLLPEENFPIIEEDTLKSWLVEICSTGLRRLSDLTTVDWYKEIKSRLQGKQGQILDQELPEKLSVPSGSQIALDYSAANGQAVLAVRLQELFGLAATPRLARGRLTVLLHLLGPNYRPVQVTTDLTSFWNGAYQEVRKEMMRRYPKHHWPLDPWTALPTSRAKKKNK